MGSTRNLKTTNPDVVIASGYGVRVYVERGHLVVHDGLGRDRSTCRFNRATAGVKRIVLIGHTGFITLDALRWIRDVGASLAQIDADGNLVTVTAAERLHESKLRRAQAIAADQDTGRVAVVELVRAKLEGQAALAEERLSRFKVTIRRNHRHEVSICDAIREQADALDPRLPFTELRKLESIAGRYYWQAWARVPALFGPTWRKDVPDHWHTAGPRTSRVDRQWPRRAVTPAHALLNYAYAILETEAVIAAHAIGFDPSLGLMHADVRYRSSLATDLMEPVRPLADALVLDLLEKRLFERGDVLETRRGTCRLGTPSIRELAAASDTFREALGAHAENLARRLLKTAVRPTPLTRARHRAAIAAGRKLRATTK
jgi:CRISP-associated protein Cas1